MVIKRRTLRINHKNDYDDDDDNVNDSWQINRKHYVTWTKTLLTKYDLFKTIIWIGWLSLQEQ